MKDKRGGGGGWWPSLVPTPAAAARRVSMWVGRAASPEEGAAPATPPTPQRPTSLVISTPPPPPPPVQRPSCSPPPPPPRSPAGSSYNTADEDSGSVPLDLPSSREGDLLQGILDIIDKQNLDTSAPDSRVDGSAKTDLVPDSSDSNTEKLDNVVVAPKGEDVVPEESAPPPPEAVEVETNASDTVVKDKTPPPLPSSPPPEVFRFKDPSSANLEDGLTTLTRRLRKMAEVLENSPINHMKEGSGSTPNSPEVGTPTRTDTMSPLQKLMDEAKLTRDDENGNKIDEPGLNNINIPGADVAFKENGDTLLTSEKQAFTNSAPEQRDEKIVAPARFTPPVDELDAEIPLGIVKGFFTVNFDVDSLTTLNSGVAITEVKSESSDPLPKNIELQTPVSEIFATPLSHSSSNPFFQTLVNSSNPFEEEKEAPKKDDGAILFADDVFEAAEEVKIKAADSVENFSDDFDAPAAAAAASGTCPASAAIKETTPAPAAITCKQDDERLPQDFKSDRAEEKEKEAPPPEADKFRDAPKDEQEVNKPLEETKVKVEEVGEGAKAEEGAGILAKKEGILKELSAVLEKKSVKFNLQAPIAMGEDDEINNIAPETPSPKVPKAELKGAKPKLEITLPAKDNFMKKAKKADADADDSGPDSSLSSDGDFTLDDATDIALDESLPGSPVPPVDKKPKSKPTLTETKELEPEVAAKEPIEDADEDLLKVKASEDDYVELARAVNYENIEFKRRPGGRLISKRRLHALHPPKLGAVRSSLSKAWLAMRDWGSENAKKIGEKLSRDSLALSEDQAEATAAAVAAAASTSAPPPLPSRGASEPPPILPRAICERARSVRLMSPGLDDVRASKYLPIEGQSGFDELRRYMKQGGDFCKELSAILQERSDAEAQYAKSLNKLSAKLARNAKDAVGSVSAAWQHAAAQMEAEGEAHRDAAAALAERVVRPLKATLEAQHRVRKSVESAVDKSGKGLAEWRMQEAKAKKNSFGCARENERLQDALQEAQRLGRSGRTPTVSDKEITKLETKRRKAEEAVKKSDVEYYTYCVRAERARLEWETAVNRGSQCFQALEEERLQHLKELIEHYYQILTQMAPKIVQSAERLCEPVQTCDVARDLQTVASVKGVGQPIPEQLLPDFYPEHVTLAMNKDRRRLALLKLLQLIRQDLERERRAKQGVENLARALQQTPTFGNEDSQQNVQDKLHHMRSMLTYLEAARYKVHSTLAELNGDRRGSHPLASHIQVTRDRQGLQQSVLKVPPWVREEHIDGPDWPDRGSGDGNSVQPDSDFDEFSSQASDDKDFGVVMPAIGETVEHDDHEMYSNLGQCRALYDYAANLCDELNLTTGDLITIREKQEDGWWLGELNGVVGIFPATYVELLEKN